MSNVKQPRPDSGLSFQVKVFKMLNTRVSEIGDFDRLTWRGQAAADMAADLKILRPKDQALMAMQASLSVEVTDQTKYRIPSSSLFLSSLELSDTQSL